VFPVGIAADTRPRLANAGGVAQIEHGNLDPSGQLLLTVKLAEQNAAKADFAELADRLGRIEKPAQHNPITVPYAMARSRVDPSTPPGKR
jgi:hypothetical protein